MSFSSFKSIIDSVSQGKVSDASGIVQAVSPTQTSFMSVGVEEIKKVLELQYSNNPTAGNAYDLARKPWIFTTFEALNSLTPTMQGSNTSNTVVGNKNLDSLQIPDRDAKRIFLAANPTNVTWNIPQRGVEEKNKSGTVHHYWYDSDRKTYFDDAKLSISFQTGNIMPLPESSDPLSNGSSEAFTPSQTRMSPSLYNFYQFLSLVDQQKIAPGGEANLIHILYRSNIFPSMVLTGLFDPQLVVQFQDDSQSPWKISGWSANFTVFSTTPRLNNYADLAQMFRSEFANVVD